MAKVAVLNHHPIMARMFARPLDDAGHDTLTSAPPFDLERIIDYGPQAIVVVLDRRPCAGSRAIADPEADIFGYEALEALEAYPAIQLIPILVLGNALYAVEVPTSARYDLFLSLPDELDRYVRTIGVLTERLKTRRRLSGFLCPICNGRLTFSRQPARDLFCPRCYTAVNLVEGDEGLMLARGVGMALPVTVRRFEGRSPSPDHL